MTKNIFGSPSHRAGNEQFEPPTDKQDRFDNPALRRVGRRRLSGGGPERSGGFAAQPRTQRRSGAERPKGGPEGVSAQRE
jgi:hypothetical protein